MKSIHVSVRSVKLAIVAAVLGITAYANSAGPPAGRTGAPGDKTCSTSDCHGGTLNSGPGSVTIEGVPATVDPNTDYTLTVRVEHPDRRRWGFQIIALDAVNNAAGTFSLIDRNITKFANGQNGRVYVEHTTAGTFANQAQGASWQLRWRSPATDPGTVTFYAAGNAANNNALRTGDSIYNTSVSTGNVDVPIILSPAYKKSKISLVAKDSNIKAGATLDVSGGGLTGTETFALVLNGKGTKWQVKSSARSTPGNMSVDTVLPAGTTVILVVKNPDGSLSTPANLTR